MTTGVGGVRRRTRRRPTGVRVLPVLLVPALLLGASAAGGAAPLPLTGRHVPAASVHHSSVAPFSLANIEVFQGSATTPSVFQAVGGFAGTYNRGTGALTLSWGAGGSPSEAGTVSLDSGPITLGADLTNQISASVGSFACNTTDGTADAVVDQLVFTGSGTIVAAAISFDCLLNDGSLELLGTVAYNVTPSTPGQGYYLFDQTGAVGGFGNDNFLGYLGDLSATPLNQPVVGMAQTPDGGGYWLTAGDGGVFAYGDAGFYGSTGSLALNKPIVGMASTGDGKGYWFVAADGGIFSFGDAGFYGSTGSLTLNKPIVGMAPTPDGRGYWLVASDGGLFAFGDAGFHGSTGGLNLTEPIEGMAATPDGRGYWMVASDGGIFAFGDAPFDGSLGGQGITDIAGISAG